MKEGKAPPLVQTSLHCNMVRDNASPLVGNTFLPMLCCRMDGLIAHKKFCLFNMFSYWGLISRYSLSKVRSIKEWTEKQVLSLTGDILQSIADLGVFQGVSNFSELDSMQGPMWASFEGLPFKIQVVYS